MRVERSDKEVISGAFTAHQRTVRVFYAHKVALSFFRVVFSHGEHGHEHPFVFKISEKHDKGKDYTEYTVADIAVPELPYGYSRKGRYEENTDDS